MFFAAIHVMEFSVGKKNLALFVENRFWQDYTKKLAQEVVQINIEKESNIN